MLLFLSPSGHVVVSGLDSAGTAAANGCHAHPCDPLAGGGSGSCCSWAPDDRGRLSSDHHDHNHHYDYAYDDSAGSGSTASAADYNDADGLTATG